jgi:hypothetical protein
MSSSFGDRLIRAARLDPQLYEEVEADVTANRQAAGVVMLSAIAAGIGSGSANVVTLLGASVVALIGWYVWAFLTWWIGTRILPEPATEATQGQLLRTIAFSSAPGILRVFGVIPPLRWITFLATGIWMLVAMVIAVRQALDYRSTARAVGVCLIGWLVQLVVIAIALAVLARGEPL